MQSSTANVLAVLCSLCLVCNSLDNSSTSTLSVDQREFIGQIQKKGPILSVELRRIVNGFICVAQSLTPVKYEVVQLAATQGSYAIINGRTAICKGEKGRVVIGCEVSTKIKDRLYKTWTYASQVNSADEKLFGKYRLYGDYLQIFDNAWHNLCVKQNDQYWLELIGKGFCKQLGFNEGRLYLQNNARGERYFINCTNEKLENCDISKSLYSNYNRHYNYHKEYTLCIYLVRFSCSGSYSKDNYRQVPQPDEMDAKLSIYPDRQIEENDNVTVTCSTKFYPKMRKMIALQKINFKGEKIDLISSIKDISFTVSKMKFSFNYIATRDLINDTFICTVKDLVSLQSNQTEQFLKYKMAFTEVNIIIYRLNYSENRQIEITEDIDQYNSADWLKCEADSEHPTPVYHWYYTALNGERRVNQSKYLQLSGVEKRMRVECRVRQELLSDNFTDSVSVELMNELSNGSNWYQEYNKSLCNGHSGNGRSSLLLKCLADEDLRIVALYVGYFDQCEADVSQCSFPMGAAFIRNERCRENSCNISSNMLKKSYLAFALKQTVSEKCLMGSRTILKVDYLCLKQMKN